MNPKAALAAVCALVLTTAGLLIGTTTTASAAPPTEVAVIPADRPLNYLTDRLYRAGATGYLHRYTSNSQLRWTRYSDGAITELDDLVAAQFWNWTWAGGDEFWSKIQVAGHSVPGSLTIVDLGRMSWRTMAQPADGTALAISGDTMLVRPTATDTPLTLRRYAPDGSFTTVAVTGVPAGTTLAHPEKSDADSVVLSFTGSAAKSYGLLDLRTGKVVPVPAEVTGTQTVLLTADRVAFRGCESAPTCPVRIYSRAGLRTGADTTALTVTVPSDLGGQLVLVGTHLIGAYQQASPGIGPPMLDYSAPGKPVVVPRLQTDGATVLPTADGGLVVGGTAGDWGVRRLTAAPDGSISQSRVFDLGGRRTTAGLTISSGRVRHIQSQRLDADDQVRYLLFNHRYDGYPIKLDGGELSNPVPCQVGQACVRTVDSNSYGTAYLGKKDLLAVRLLLQDAIGPSGVSSTVGEQPVLLDVSGGYAVVNDVRGQRVLKPGWSDFVERTGPAGAGALLFAKLWTSPAAGTLRAMDVETGAVTSTVTTGATCVPDEMQVAQRLVYFSCGTGGPAGVYDIERRVTIALPPGRYLLGDGFVVRHQAGQLVMHDLTSGALGDPVVLASLPNGAVTDDRNITWAVDKYMGNIAYVDAQDAVHVVDPGVPASPPVVIDRSFDRGTSVYFGDNGELIANWSLSRAIDSWKLTMARVSNGEIVATITGGPGYSVRATWDGRLASGAKSPSGRYRYTLTATADGTSTLLDSDIVRVECGTPLYRSYNCAGTPAVLGVLKSGEGHWLTVDNGTVRDNGATESWVPGTGNASLTSALVPFGDLNRDGHNDLLVRNGAGTLTVHYGIGQEHFGGRRTKVVGTGWGGIKQILTSGDLTGDGIPDVLGQDSAGVLRRYNGTSAGVLANGSVVPGAWTTYPRLIGPGDLNGDGRADLYGITSAGQLDVFFGTGTGTFGAATRVGTGWSSYTVIGAGDTNEDGRNDVVARDSSGNLWMYPGNGVGGLSSRKPLGTGYQKFTGLY